MSSIASAYGYITVADLEAKMKITFDAFDARYTDAAVEAEISQAERWVNEYCGQSFSGTIPDGVIFATTEMAKYFMNQQMVEDEHLEKLPRSLDTILKLCREPLLKHKKAIPYTSSLDRYHLPNQED